MAQRIPQEVIETIRGQTNIVEVIGQYVQLKKSGKNYLGLCPFHEERTPSFSVAEDKQIFHCFGCGKGGNVFTFLQELEGLSFPEAVVKVADFEQIQLEDQWRKQTLPFENSDSITGKLILAHEKAAEVYHHMLLHTKVGEQALDYLLQRGLTLELIEEFAIGFAPNERSFLKQVFKTEAYDQEVLERSGLFISHEDGGISDRFYQRIMFPIRNPQGRTIGFSGRWLAPEKGQEKDQPKYLNSPETELFNKRQVLFNLDKARSDIRKSGEVLLFEGFMDVIASWQAGVKNGIASMGTSLTNQQIQQIERVTKELVFCYDGDKAGFEATNRGIELLRQNSRLQLSIVVIPEKLDPDEYLRKYGNDSFNELIFHGRETVFTFKSRYLKQDKNLENEKDKIQYLEEVSRELSQVVSPIEQDMYLSQLATEFQLSRETLQKQIRDFRRENQTNRTNQPTTLPEPAISRTAITKNRPLTQVEKAEQMLLYRVFKEISVRNLLKEQQFQFIHDIYAEVYFLFDAFVSQHDEFNLAEFLDFLQDENLRRLVVEIEYLRVAEESTPREIQDLLRVIRKSSLADEITLKKQMQQEARRTGNKQLELELTIEIINLTKQLKQAE
ncbi:DNA primase [Enterococcus hirae]|uniref:DNA primase n=1 Tax=Enterococcus hirae TaxID=1354 RepID=A0AB37IN81_ENTHR|nr:DNA primase [Enterococcus hirae]EMF0151717.1 DNA primase [Enterococcus hirae]EMF0242481.1 DNA primase [Enterococcus hirae]EMF0384120.1 DNA primase [Enterococcus hirae]EMF0424975.1 DNA primase [Enterococcus hirae]EMF0435160.1 DNA primase [Enterococcus hirae]